MVYEDMAETAEIDYHRFGHLFIIAGCLRPKEVIYSIELALVGSKPARARQVPLCIVHSGYQLVGF